MRPPHGLAAPRPPRRLGPRRQEAAAQAEIDEEKKQRLEQQQATGKFLLFLGLGFLYLLWLQDFVPPILDVIAQKLGFRRFIRVGELTGRGAGAPEPPDL